MHKIIPIPAFHDNYIWLIVNAEKQSIAVDPGDAAPVLKFIADNNLTLDHILITHHHPDHTDGVTELVEKTQASVFASMDTNIPNLELRLADQDQFTLDTHGLTFKVIATPGHTLDHICYYTPGHLFCGDTVFAGGCGRIFEGNAKMMYTSLKKISNLPHETLIYCAHEYTLQNLKFAQKVEPENTRLQQRIKQIQLLRQQKKPSVPSSLAEELATNPFLRCEHDSVKFAAQNINGQNDISPDEVFAIIRQWKDKQ
jgi:hydroxyacylglutathione hydrolase